MKVGSIIYLKKRLQPHSGFLTADGTIDKFDTSDFPELAEVFEFIYDCPDGLRTMGIPVIDLRDGLVPHIVGRESCLSDIQYLI